MAYARFGKDSDIYFYGHNPDEDGFECVACCLRAGEVTLIYGVENAIAHVQEHIDAGNKVEDDVIPMILADHRPPERGRNG